MSSYYSEKWHDNFPSGHKPSNIISFTVTQIEHAEMIKHLKMGIVAIAIFAWLMYVLGLIWPEEMWAVNHVGLLPRIIGVGLLGITLLMVVMPLWLVKVKIPSIQLPRLLVLILIPLLFGMICFLFPIAHDIYGDAIHVKSSIDITISKWDDRLITEIFQPDWLDTKVGLKTFFELNNLLSWVFGVPGSSVCVILGAVFGSIYAFTWIKYCQSQLNSAGWRWLFLIVGITSPMMAVFMGHFESYYLAYAAILGWFYLLTKYFQSGSSKLLFVLPIVFLVVLQTHITNWLLFPSLITAFAWHFKGKAKFIKKLFTWQGMFYSILLPIMVIGIISYFFIFENHNGPRQFSKQEFEDSLFLPIYTLEPPPFDRYNLFSIAHLVDYFNLALMWAGSILVLLIPALTIWRNTLNDCSPELLVVGITLLIYCMAFFALNPLLSAAGDWDLFALPGVVAMPFLLLFYSKIEKAVSPHLMVGPIVGLSLLGCVNHVVNVMPDLLKNKYSLMGVNNFKNYWIGSSTDLLESANMEIREVERQARIEGFLHELQPYAIKGNDREYAALLTERGLYYKRWEKRPDIALSYFEKAEKYSPKLGTNLYNLTITRFELGLFEDAFKSIDLLAKLKYQPYKRTLKMAIHVSLAAEEYQSAANYSVTYLNRWRDDPAIAEIEYRLRTGDRIDQLVNLFDGK